MRCQELWHKYGEGTILCIKLCNHMPSTGMLVIDLVMTVYMTMASIFISYISNCILTLFYCVYLV